ncbi:citrate (Si)-synthase [Mangrovibacterium diazotrophicum]|uniref:citrate synthase (unknown stereospecificity) n=1 Tax=Mangrovibacterium diazotrophicum TaxID=1261403 RepID=A0A419VXM2_9BACT|nr:citrate (Si)-synthase [Mangrovibacterium diazotrophicum]RKD87956.1 citrate synthase [Mangrovibacterium diazotrophicum]
MEKLLAKVDRRIKKLGDELQQLYTEHPDATIGEITFQNLLSGMRGMKSLICNTSFVDPYRGLFISGLEVPDFEHKTPEEIFFLLVTGTLPSKSELEELSSELKKRSKVPEYVWKMLRSLPKTIHPMTMFSLGILAMEGESVFKKKYEEGLHKDEYWKYTLEDSLNLIAKLPSLAAGIYRILFMNGDIIDSDQQLDLAGNLTQRLGFNRHNQGFEELNRLYLVLHCDHEGGNVSAFTSRVVNSALSNIYYAASAGLNGLAGPLHGLANQECLHFITNIHDTLGNKPSVDEIRKYVMKTLDDGKVIPGYGHAVLRVTDPRFTAFMKFGDKHCPESPYLQTVKKLYEVVPDILKTYKGGKVSNPWPNVDAISGSLLYHYGMTHYEYYTVMFGISRVLGFCAQNTIARGLHQPIIRPKSVTNSWLKEHLESQTVAGH